MNLRTVKKKFRQEVLVDSKGKNNGTTVLIRRFVVLCAKASAGLALSIFLGPVSLLCPIEIWLMKLGPDKASHFINGIEAHLRRSQLEKKKKSIKIVVWTQKFPNVALAKMYRRVVYIVGPKQKFFADIMPFVIWKAKVFRHDVNRVDSEFIKRMSLGSPSINFSKKENRFGESLMIDLFGCTNKEFVVFGYTSSEYRTAVDQHYHPLDDLTSAIPDPTRFCDAIKMLSDRGIGVVRMGHMLSDNRELERAGLIVPDYSKYPSGFVDVWLAAKCKFLVSACTGSWWFGVPFDKPCVITDSYTPTAQPFVRHALQIFQIPKYLGDKKNAKFYWIKANPRWCFDTAKINSVYVSEKNSSEQICEIILEMVMRLSNTWKESEEDTKLQMRFQRNAFDELLDYSHLPRIGAKFLREHQHLLPD